MSAHKSLFFPATRADALQKASDFAPHMDGEYARLRNYVLPGHPYVSRLAPAIRTRLLSESELVGIALQESGALNNCEKFVQEVYWRSYWRSWLELRPAIWRNYARSLHELQQNLSPEQQRRVRQLENGESGVEPMDNFTRELVETGFLHNHARMWFAAFWIHTEKLPWELGADFFDRNLVCACSASNTLSWRWVAGLQTAGKPYLARASNLEKYCDPAYLGSFAGRERLRNPTPASLTIPEIPAPQKPEFQLGVEVSKGKVGLWIHEDDLSPEISVLSSTEFDAICLTVLEAPTKSARSNGLRRKYRLGAIDDAARRSQDAWNVSTEQIEPTSQAELVRQLSAWAKEQHLETIVALKPFVGPGFGTLDALKAQLERQEVELQLLRREEDALLLNNATAGFFRFWQSAKGTLIG